MTMAFVITVTSCSKPEDVNSTYSELMKEYNINKKGLIIDYSDHNADQTYIVFNGRIDNRLWVGYYDMETKAPLLDWTDDNVLETTITVDVGYGETETHSINNLKVFYICYNEGTFSFRLSYSVGNRNSVGLKNLYFIRNEKLIESYNLEEYDVVDGEGHALSTWFRGFIAGEWCFDTYGKKLFEFGRDEHHHLLSVRNAEPISHEEAIVVNFIEGYSSPDNTPILNVNARFSRLNLKNGYKWTSEAPFGDIIPFDARARLDDVVINKSADNTVWEYLVSYTLFDGTKEIANIALNIDTGSFGMNISIP